MNGNTYDDSIVCLQMRLGSFKNVTSKQPVYK